MGLDAVKNLFSSIKTCYRSLTNHPLILALVFTLILLYKFLPSVLTFFISSSPILVCTAVLLRTFLSFGSQDTSRIESKRTVRARLIDDDTAIVKKDGSLFSSEARSSRKRWEIIGRTGSIAIASSTNSERKVTFSPTHNPRIQKNDTQMDNIEHQVSQGSYPDASSMEDMIPELDDMRPLLESKPVASDGFEVASDDTDRSIDGSVDSDEVENHEEEEQVGEEEDANKSVVTWTEDDQKNLMDLGTSELERNQRLENLIAKRRARKSFNRSPEKNLIDLDSITDPPPFQLSNISTMKTNPFDIPYDSSANEIEGLPPIPGSAPSIMAPRRNPNPFDLPYDPLEERPNLTGDSFHQEFMAILQRDMFCRHESFSLGNSFSGVPKFSPHFTNGGMALQKTGCPTIQEQQLGTASKFSKQLPPVSEISAQEGPKKPNEEKIIQEDENPSINSSSDSVEQEKQNPEPVDDLMETIQEEKTDHVILNNADNGELEKDLSLPPTSASSSQMNEKNIESEVPERNRSDSTEKIPGEVLKRSTTTEDSDVKTSAANGVVEEPLYDSSPSEIEKRTIEESLFCIDKEVALASTSIASDLVVEVSEVGSPQLERTISYTDPGDTLNGNGETQIGSGNNDAIEENGSKPSEVIKIIKCDVKDDGFVGDKHESKDSNTAPMEEGSETEPALVDSESDSVPVNQSKEQVMNLQITSSVSNEAQAGVH